MRANPRRWKKWCLDTITQHSKKRGRIQWCRFPFGNLTRHVLCIDFWKRNCSTREAFLLRARVYQSIWYSCLIHVFFGLKYEQNYQFIHFQNMSYQLKNPREVKKRWIVKVHSCSPLNSWVIPFSKMTRSSETRAERRWWSSCVSSFEMEDLSC